MRISNSFSEGEIAVFDALFKHAITDKKLLAIVRNKDFPSAWRKVIAMRARVATTGTEAKADTSASTGASGVHEKVG